MCECVTFFFFYCCQIIEVNIFETMLVGVVGGCFMSQLQQDYWQSYFGLPVMTWLFCHHSFHNDCRFELHHLICVSQSSLKTYRLGPA